jgi:uncharacterized membrane protein
LVEGRVVFGALVCSAGAVLMTIILGLRYLDGTLGGRYATGSLLLSALFAAVVAVVLVLSLTDWLGRGAPDPSTPAPAEGANPVETHADRDLL